MIFLIFLTIGFVYEYGKGALKFTDNRSSITRASLPGTTNSNPLPTKIVRRRLYSSSGALLHIREYHTVQVEVQHSPRLTGPGKARAELPLPEVNPSTGLPFTTDEAREYLLASIKPVSP